MGLNTGGKTSARPLGRSAQRFSATYTPQGSSVGYVRRTAVRLTNVIFKHPSRPTVASYTPATGLAAGGTAVTITGLNIKGATGVTVGGTAGASFVSVSDTSATFSTPAKAAGTYPIVLLHPGGDIAVGNFVYT